MKRVAPVVLLLLAAGGAVYFWLQRQRPPEALVLAGTIEARTVEVGPLAGGRVTRVAVEEGAEVEAGALLAELDDPLLPPQLDSQRAAVAAARAAVDLALAGPRREARDRARIAWEAAKTDLGRIENLYRDGVVGRQEYDAAVVREQTAQRTALEAERGSRREEIDAAKAELARQEALLVRFERQAAELRIVAPVAGRIESFDLRPGDLVAAQQPVAVLLEPRELWVRVYVPETRLGLVTVGQKVRLEVDSFPGRPFDGEVVEIRHRAEYLPRNVQTVDQRADQVFGVKVAIAAADDLRPGMAASVSFPPPGPPAPNPAADAR
jgi:multidrug resistance efflux pump